MEDLLLAEAHWRHLVKIKHEIKSRTKRRPAPAPEILSVWWLCINSCASDPRKRTAAMVAARMAATKIDLIFMILTSSLFGSTGDSSPSLLPLSGLTLS